MGIMKGTLLGAKEEEVDRKTTLQIGDIRHTVEVVEERRKRKIFRTNIDINILRKELKEEEETVIQKIVTHVGGTHVAIEGGVRMLAQMRSILPKVDVAGIILPQKKVTMSTRDLCLLL